MLHLYDTLHKSIKPIASEGPARLYSCGPTVYDHAHIGNLRSFVFADTIRRVLEFDGQTVDWVMNITDVDDKTIKRTTEKYGALATPADLKEFTDEYTAQFLKDLQALNIDTTRIRFIRVSEVIPQIQKFVVELLDKGYAYRAEDGSTYFSIEKYQADFGDYGALVGKGFLEGKKTGARVAVDEYEKENLSDFALWKARHDDDGHIFWNHEQLGEGRPGWHIECSAINAIAFENKPTTIHTGGVDLIFPHHTNEIAQSQPLYKPFTDLWAHSEFLQINGQKMSKRFNNYYTLTDLQEKTALAGPALRYLFLQSDFRSQQNFTDESFEAARSGLQHLYNVYDEQRHEDVTKLAPFTEALDNNLNTAEALANAMQTGDNQALTKMDEVLGLGLKTRITEIPTEVQELLIERESARQAKDFAKSDELRAAIEQLGYELKDTPEGQKVTRK
jgi:cysteinyl-tRNA synthetase